MTSLWPGFGGATGVRSIFRLDAGAASSRRTGWDGVPEERDRGVDGSFNGGRGSLKDCCLSFSRTSSSLSVLSSRTLDEERAGSGGESVAAPPVHMEISGNLSGLSDVTVGAVFVASRGAGGGSSSVLAGLPPDRVSSDRKSTRVNCSHRCNS